MKVPPGHGPRALAAGSERARVLRGAPGRQILPALPGVWDDAAAPASPAVSDWTQHTARPERPTLLVVSLARKGRE